MSGYTSIVDSSPMFVPGTFDAQDVRLATVGNALPGLFARGDFAVSQRAAGANMSVDIAPGRAYVNPAAVARQGSYLAWYGSTFNTSSDGGYTWTAADPTNPRIDLVCIEAADTDFGGSFTGWKWRVVDGTPNAGATAVGLRAFWPAVPAGCVAVAAVRVPNGATTLTTANILNLDNVGGPQVAGRESIQSFVGSGTILATGGRVVTFSGAAAQTITVPVGEVGMAFDIYNLDSADSVSIARSGSDTFNGSATSMTLTAGDRITLCCIAANTWIVSGNGIEPDPIAIHQSWGSLTAGVVAGTYALPGGGAGVLSPANMSTVPFLPLIAADHVRPGRICQLRLSGQLLVNATAPTGNFTFDLLQITSLAGGAGILYNAAGTTRLTATQITAPSAATGYRVTSPWTDFVAANFPEGAYTPRVTNSATIAASSHLALQLFVEKRYI